MHKTKLLTLLFLMITAIGFSQNTYVPDDNFEKFLETHNIQGVEVAFGDIASMENQIKKDDYVTTTSIENVAKEKLFIKSYTKAVFNLYNLKGKLLITESITEEINTINISNTSKGLYITEIKSKNGKSIKK